MNEQSRYYSHCALRDMPVSESTCEPEQSMSEPLKPCPNPECVSRNVRGAWLQSCYGADRFVVMCDNCGMRGPVASSYASVIDNRIKQEAADKWNLLPRAEPVANSQRAREVALEVYGD